MEAMEAKVEAEAPSLSAPRHSSLTREGSSPPAWTMRGDTAERAPSLRRAEEGLHHRDGAGDASSLFASAASRLAQNSLPETASAAGAEEWLSRKVAEAVEGGPSLQRHPVPPGASPTLGIGASPNSAENGRGEALYPPPPRCPYTPSQPPPGVAGGLASSEPASSAVGDAYAAPFLERKQRAGGRGGSSRAPQNGRPRGGFRGPCLSETAGYDLGQRDRDRDGDRDGDRGPHRRRNAPSSELVWARGRRGRLGGRVRNRTHWNGSPQGARGGGGQRGPRAFASTGGQWGRGGTGGSGAHRFCCQELSDFSDAEKGLPCLGADTPAAAQAAAMGGAMEILSAGESLAAQSEGVFAASVSQETSDAAAAGGAAEPRLEERGGLLHRQREGAEVSGSSRPRWAPLGAGGAASPGSASFRPHFNQLHGAAAASRGGGGRRGGCASSAMEAGGVAAPGGFSSSRRGSFYEEEAATGAFALSLRGGALPSAKTAGVGLAAAGFVGIPRGGEEAPLQTAPPPPPAFPGAALPAAAALAAGGGARGLGVSSIFAFGPDAAALSASPGSGGGEYSILLTGPPAAAVGQAAASAARLYAAQAPPGAAAAVVGGVGGACPATGGVSFASAVVAQQPTLQASQRVRPESAAARGAPLLMRIPAGSLPTSEELRLAAPSFYAE